MDSDELLRLFFAERPALEAYLLAATRDYHLTEDLLQEVAIVLVRKAEEYDTSRPFGPWARGIARRELASYLRARADEAAVLDPETLEVCAPAFETVWLGEHTEARKAALAECVETVSDGGRKVLELRYHERLSCPEIARALGRTVQAVYGILKRVKNALRECVEARLGEARP